MKPATKTVTWAAACCTLVGAFEGCDFTAKKDLIGTGQPLTWCHGETIGNARAGQKFTRAECDAMLSARLPDYWAEIEPAIKVDTSDNEKIAFTSTSYNIGSAAFRRSAMLRKLNAGDHQGACDALMKYTHARGVVVRGLVIRRGAERKVCLTPDGAANSPALRKAAIPKVFAPEPPKVCGGEWTNDRTYTSHPECRQPLPPVVAPVAKPKPKFLSWAWWTE